jgi:uncharacterized integral membrane protein
MPLIILVGPAVALIGIVAVVFVMRHKSEEKRSMYSARRSQIEHKVRAARQRTLTPHGRPERPPEAPPPPAGSSIFAPAPSAPQMTYQPSAYEPPPAAPAPEVALPPEMPQGSPWEVGPTSPAPFGAPPETVPGQYPPSQPAPAEPPYTPAEPAYTPIEPAYTPTPSEPAWNPAAAAPAAPLEAVEPATAAASPGSWSVVSESKESASTGSDQPRKKEKKGSGGSAWQLASGNAPGDEDADVVKAPSPLMAIAQYAVLVVGLVMVLIGVFVMIANSHVT